MFLFPEGGGVDFLHEMCVRKEIGHRNTVQ